MGVLLVQQLVVVQVAALAQRCQVEQACRLWTVVVHMRGGQYDFAACDWMRLAVYGAAPLAPSPRAHQSNEPAA